MSTAPYDNPVGSTVLGAPSRVRRTQRTAPRAPRSDASRLRAQAAREFRRANGPQASVRRHALLREMAVIGVLIASMPVWILVVH